MRRLITVTIIVLSVLMMIFSGCSNGDLEPDSGALTLSITDSPIQDDALTGVWITIKGVEAHTPEGGWQSYEGAIPDEAINLMELTSGTTEILGTAVPVVSGRYTQIRFLLDIQETSDGVPNNPGCYVTFDDDNDPLTEDVEYPLFVPSGDTSGYKAVKSFTVPVNGTIAVTADFDVRKALVNTSTSEFPHYILKPTIRLVVDNEAGWIHGPVAVDDVPVAASSIVVYAYTDGTWTNSETDEPLLETETRFSNAVTSAVVEENADTGENSFKLAFLAAGSYDIAAALYDTDGNFIQTWGFYSNAQVTETKGTVIGLNAESLSPVLE